VLAPERASGFKSPPSHSAEIADDSETVIISASSQRKGLVDNEVDNDPPPLPAARARASLLEQAAMLTRAGAVAEADALIAAAQALPIDRRQVRATELRSLRGGKR
jgi:hypothetical protein